MLSYVLVGSILVHSRESFPGRFINYETRVGLADVQQQSSVDLTVNRICDTMPTDLACEENNVYLFHCRDSPIYGRYVTINPIRPNLNSADNWVWHLSTVQVYKKLGQGTEACTAGEKLLLSTV